MQLILPIIAIGIAVAVTLLNHPQDDNNEEKILSVKTEVKVSSETPTPTSPPPDPTSTPTPSTAPQPPASSGEFVYPNSKDNGSGNYESADDPDAITNWYKEKIKSMGMNVKTFVTTKTNGNVLNKLSGANSEINISVEIEKKENENITKIKISLESS